MTGLYQVAPDAPVSHANVSFPLDYEARQHFAALASAGVFVGGGSGTLEEFEISQQLEIKPLIPVAGAGGAGEYLANEMRAHPEMFFRVPIENGVKNVLAASVGSAVDYQRAVENVLKEHKLGPKRFYTRG